MVYNLALRLTGNPSDAQDLTQDSFVKAIRGLRNFKGQSDPGSWLYRITMNAWKNRVRSEKRRAFWKTFSIESWLPSGEEVGRLLNRLREAEIAGKVRTREEALEFLKNLDSSRPFGYDKF